MQHAGTYFDVTSSATIATSTPAVASMAINANGALVNRIRPSATGSTAVSATLGSWSVNTTFNIVASTGISAIDLQPQFDDAGIDPNDPTVSECSLTFRGDIGTTSELVATFHFTENDVLTCPVTIPVGSLSRGAIQDDYITLGSVLNGMFSSRSASVAIVAPDWSPPHPSGFDLLLQDSASSTVTLTATSTCVAAGMRRLSSASEICALSLLCLFTTFFPVRLGSTSAVYILLCFE